MSLPVDRFVSSWRRESNPRPRTYHARALPTELLQRDVPGNWPGIRPTRSSVLPAQFTGGKSSRIESSAWRLQEAKLAAEFAGEVSRLRLFSGPPAGLSSSRGT